MKTVSLFVAISLSLVPSIIATCSHDSDCLHGGECNNAKCECSVIRWSGENCEIRTETYLGQRYDVYYYITLITTWIVFVTCAVKLWFVYRASRKFSMVHLALWMLTVAMFLRGLNYILEVDGHYFRNDSLEPFSGLCFYLFYPFIISAYLCELFLWMELYRAVTHIQVENLPRYRHIFFAVNGFMFPLELVTRIIVTVFKDTSTGIIFIAIWTCYIGIALLLETIGFIVMSVLVLQKLSPVKAITGQEQARKIFVQVSLVLNGLAVLLILGLASVIYFFLATDAEVFYGLLWFCRIVEFSVVIGLVLVIRPPRSEHGSSFELMEPRGVPLSKNPSIAVL